MKKFLCLITALLLFSGSAYAKHDKKTLPPKLTAEELMAIQTRAYPNVDSFVIMKAILNVMQDNYYFVEDADSKIGFIRANREFDTRDKYINIKEEFGCSKKMAGIKRLSVAKTEATVTVTPNEDNINIVRVNIRKKVMNMYDIEIRVKDVVDDEIYNKFFAALNKELKKHNICNIEKKEQVCEKTIEKNDKTSESAKTQKSISKTKTKKIAK